MSYCRREASGKDKSVFVTKEDSVKKELVKELVEEDSYGVILPSGEINWDCPCLGDLPRGSCGEEFKTAFSCFINSKEEEKGMDCVHHFKAMQECFQNHPEEYAKYAEDEPEEAKAGDTKGEPPSSPTTVASNESTSTTSDGKTPSPLSSASSENVSSSSSASSNKHTQEQWTTQTGSKSRSEPQLESQSKSKLGSIQVSAT